MHEIRLYLHELESMPEYSRSIPTGTTLWKMWRRNTNDGWYVGQYVPPSKLKSSRGVDLIGIRWFRVVLKHGPPPPVYRTPDWDNYARHKRELEACHAAGR